VIFVSAKQASQLRWPSDVPTLVASFLPLQLHGIVPFVCTVQFSLNDNILKPKIRHVNAIVIACKLYRSLPQKRVGYPLFFLSICDRSVPTSYNV